MFSGPIVLTISEYFRMMGCSASVGAGSGAPQTCDTASLTRTKPRSCQTSDLRVMGIASVTLHSTDKLFLQLSMVELHLSTTILKPVTPNHLASSLIHSLPGHDFKISISADDLPDHCRWRPCCWSTMNGTPPVVLCWTSTPPHYPQL